MTGVHILDLYFEFFKVNVEIINIIIVSPKIFFMISYQLQG